jgi:hypothetical protein
MGAFNKLFGRLRLTSDVNVATQTTTVIQTDTTNSNLAIVPNGTGALIASVPDGTTTGGNARGANAVDLQSVRTANTQVASGARSVIVAGQNNSVTATDSIIVGGNGNTLNKVTSFIGGGQSNSMGGTFGSHSVIVGGQSNSIANRTHVAIVGGQSNELLGGWGFIGGGLANYMADVNYSNISGGQSNAISSTNSTISGGQGNQIGTSANHSTISGGQSNIAATGTHATVVGGQGNTASGAHSIAGGNSSTASQTKCIALGGAISSGGFSTAIGDSVSASGFKSVAIGADASATQTGAIAIGNLVTASAENSFAGGSRSTAYLYGQNSRGNGFFTANSDAQQSELTARRDATLTTGATTVLSLDGTGVTNLIIPNGSNRMWNVQVRWVAVVTAITGTATGVTVGDTKSSTDLLAVARRSGTTTVSAHTSAGTHVIETIAGSLTAANINYTAGGSGQMQITFTGPTFGGGGSVTMRVVAATSITEVAY